MATLGKTYMTLADEIKQRDGKGNIVSHVIELLHQTNELLGDANVIECNDGTSHLHTIRTGLPTAVFRKFYGFVPPSKSENAQVKDGTGMLEAYSVVDKDLVEKSKDPQQLRLNEAAAFIEAMNDQMQTTFFYGNTSDDNAKFDGLAVRYGKKSALKSNIGSNIVDAGGSGSINSSVWFVTWGDLHTSLLFPENTAAGIKREDDGVITETDANGGKRKVYQEHFKWDTGLALADWRSTARVANIDTTALLAGTVKIDDFMLAAYYKIRKYSKTGRTVIYANSDVLLALHKIAKSQANVHLSIGQFQGEEVVMFLGKVPIKECEQILNTEGTVA